MPRKVMVMPMRMVIWWLWVERGSWSWSPPRRGGFGLAILLIYLTFGSIEYQTVFNMVQAGQTAGGEALGSRTPRPAAAAGPCPERARGPRSRAAAGFRHGARSAAAGGSRRGFAVCGLRPLRRKRIRSAGAGAADAGPRCAAPCRTPAASWRACSRKTGRRSIDPLTG